MIRVFKWMWSVKYKSTCYRELFILAGNQNSSAGTACEGEMTRWQWLRSSISHVTMYKVPVCIFIIVIIIVVISSSIAAVFSITVPSYRSQMLFYYVSLGTVLCVIYAMDLLLILCYLLKHTCFGFVLSVTPLVIIFAMNFICERSRLHIWYAHLCPSLL